MTRNLWIQHEDEVATWSCCLPALVDAPEEIRALVTYIVDAGARDGVVVFDVNPLEHDHPHVTHTSNVPAVLLNGRYGANMCWFDPADVLSCGLVRDLGNVLAATANADDQINEAFRVEGLPPVRIVKRH